MFISKIPIFITLRGNNDDIFNMSKEALKYAYLFINDLNIFSQTYIISDNKELLGFAKNLGFNNIIYYECKTKKDLLYLEYFAMYKYGIDNNFHPDWVIILNSKQIFKQPSLLRDCIKNIDDKYDVIASYSIVSDKSNYFIDDNIKNQKFGHLLSSEICKKKIIDNSICAVKSSFAFECMNYEDPSEHFWNGKIKYFLNNSLYSDIHCLSDIKKYDMIYNVIQKTKNIEII